MREDVLILSVKLQSGDFESTLKIPFPCEDPQAVVEKWLDVIQMGFKVGATDMRVQLKEDEK